MPALIWNLWTSGAHIAIDVDMAVDVDVGANANANDVLMRVKVPGECQK